MKLEQGSALIIVDIQIDFCPGGALPVPDGDKIVPIANQYIRIFLKAGLPVFVTRDWHPFNHVSFKAEGGIWPPHCVQGAKGAAFHHDLFLPENVMIISKGNDPVEEAYSGFQGTSLSAQLNRRGIRRVFTGGLAVDYCVKMTILDALRHGFETILLEDASKGVELAEGDTAMAISEMRQAGAQSIQIKDLESD
ncbi:MAG: nicotinamidase [Nitrospiria bacterium]